MTNKLSIRTKITLWFSAALVLIVALTYFVGIAVSNQVIQKTIRDSLIETVENNVDEVEFFYSIENVDLENDVDHFIEYKDGFLEIDDDFLNQVNQVYTSLYTADGSLIYGENPIASKLQKLEFTDSKISQLKVGATKYYIFDRKLTAKGTEGLWLRGVVSEEQGQAQLSEISHMVLLILPLILIFTIGGGYIIAARTLNPIKKIADSADQITHGDDLKKRIEIGEGNDELHQLANSFNDMFSRLDNAFEAEKQFTSDASHELRTPMAVILAQCELSLENDLTVEEYKEALGVINRQGNKMSNLISDMLDFARLELKTDKYEKTDLNLSELVSSVCNDLALIGEKDITLVQDVEPGINFIGNHNLLSRLVVNLVTNAYRYGKQGGKIQVTLRPLAGNIYLTVKDDGIGIKDSEKEKIFDRFYQADSSHSGEGTGLGLSMAKEIAHFHGGKITVNSEEGVGSTFAVVFPLSNI